MNDILNNVLLAGDKFKPEMHFRQNGFTYSAYGPATKKKKKKKKKKLRKREIHDIFIKMNQIKHVLKMT